jgi:antitoxin YefM
VLSKETSYSQARANLASILDEVVDQQQIFIVKRRNGKNVALIAEDELSSLLECVNLLRSPENADRLHRALLWSESEEAQPQTVDELKQELGIDEGPTEPIGSKSLRDAGANAPFGERRKGMRES